MFMSEDFPLHWEIVIEIRLGSLKSQVGGRPVNVQISLLMSASYFSLHYIRTRTSTILGLDDL